MASFAESENIANLGIAALFVSTINVIELFLAQLDWSIQLLSIFTAHLNCQVRIKVQPVASRNCYLNHFKEWNIGTQWIQK